MSNPNAEAQRRWRQRQKEKRKEALTKADKAPGEIFRTPFFEWADLSYSDVDLCLALAGIKMPEFSDDRGPEEFVLNDATAGVEDPFDGASGSLGRAEVMVGCLISAAVELASTINSYKKKEIKDRIAELEQSDIADPATRKRVLAEVVRLNRMKDALDKQVRWTFPQWKIKDQ
jgi:hypothetical protein